MSRRLLKNTFTVGGNTFVSRILGLIRDVVIARAFGAELAADAFFVAFRIPNFLRRLFAEGAFSQAFVPVLSEYKERKTHEEVRDLAAHVNGALGACLFLVTLVGVLAAPVLVIIFAPGFLEVDDKYDLTVRMMRITFPYLLFISLTSFAAGILNTYGRFGVPAFTPVFLNLCLIGAALWFAPRMAEPVMALAWGVFLAGIVQLAFQLPFLKQIKMLTWPRLRAGHEGVSRIIKLIIPATFGVSVSQINLLVDTMIASFLVTGSVSWLYYSDRMVEFPLGVCGIALATAILPSLSKDHATGSTDAFSETIDWGLRWALLIATPAAVGLALLAGPILTTLFQYGAFTPDDVKMARLSLMAYSFGLLGFVAIKILAPGFYARQDTRTPVRIAVVAMLANIVLNLLLVGPMRHAGLALATSLAAFINAGLLLRGLLKISAYRPKPGWYSFLSKVIFANLVMALALWLLRGPLSLWLDADLGSRAVRLTIMVLGGGVVYGLCLLGTGVRPGNLWPKAKA